MEFAALLPILKMVGVGAGGGSIVFIGYLVWLHITVTGNRKKTNKNEEVIGEHSIVLGQISTQLNNVDENVTKLVDYHMNGRRKK